jgi:hypothetical protein
MFFMNPLPPASKNNTRKSSCNTGINYTGNKMAVRIIDTEISHWYQRHRRQILSTVPLVLLIPVAKLPLASTKPVANLQSVSTTPVLPPVSTTPPAANTLLSITESLNSTFFWRMQA